LTVPPLPPELQAIGLYLADLASKIPVGARRGRATVDRCLAGLGWNFRQRGARSRTKRLQVWTNNMAATAVLFVM
jgi:hypothetical protein